MASDRIPGALAREYAGAQRSWEDDSRMSSGRAYACQPGRVKDGALKLSSEL
jgi:hypothetical protein